MTRVLGARVNAWERWCGCCGCQEAGHAQAVMLRRPRTTAYLLRACSAAFCRVGSPCRLAAYCARM
jgi:hypothetical protein